MNCPQCHQSVSKEDINVKTDLAHCQHCNHVFKLSEQLGTVTSDSSVDPQFDMKRAPKGAWIRQDVNTLIIGATTRSPMAFFLVPFMLIWSGGSMGGIYGTQILQGKFDLFMSLFGIPFLIGTIVLGGFTLMTIWGKTEIALDKRGGVIFTGIGKVGRRKRFQWNDISSISEGLSNTRVNGRNVHNIVLEGQKRMAFGVGLNSSRRYYLLQSLNYIFRKIKEGRNPTI